ncbi:hypothetical protein EII25_01400 [Erysipelotrichaceae bacterium OH741_COT-311]|nr:hypothetical protein EII25_01400 [Erysipelotrichaceae bacterium OH741_COT-311]
MKTFITVLLLCFLVGCQPTCKLDGNQACKDKETGKFQIEEEASLVVAVENEAYGQRLVELWDKTYPKHQGLLNYVVYQNFDYQEFQDIYADVVLLWDSYAVRMQDYLLDLQVDGFKDHLASNFMFPTKEITYLPISAVGSFFSTNISMLETMGYDVVDENQDGLVDAFDTFEEIAGMDVSKQEGNQQPLLKMPLYLDDFFTSFVFTTNGFSFNHDLKEYGFTTSEFKASLQAIQQLNTMFEETEFLYEDYLSKEVSPFSLVTTWMYYQQYQDINGVDFRFSAFPTLNGKHFTPLAHSKGYSVNTLTKYPSAAFALIELMFSQEGLNLYIKHTDSILLYNHLHEDPYALTFKNEDQLAISKAFLSSMMEDYRRYERADVQVFEFVKEPAYLDVYKKVFRQEMGVEEAVEEMNRLYAEFYNRFQQVEK